MTIFKKLKLLFARNLTLSDFESYLQDGNIAGMESEWNKSRKEVKEIKQRQKERSLFLKEVLESINIAKYHGSKHTVVSTSHLWIKGFLDRSFFLLFIQNVIRSLEIYNYEAVYEKNQNYDTLTINWGIKDL